MDEEQTGNDEQTTAFVIAVQECRNCMTRIDQVLDDHFGLGPHDVTWGHVGTAQRLLELLKEAEGWAVR